MNSSAKPTDTLRFLFCKLSIPQQMGVGRLFNGKLACSINQFNISMVSYSYFCCRMPKIYLSLLVAYIFA